MNTPRWPASDDLETLIALALSEDGVTSDITTRTVVPPGVGGVGHVVAKAAGRIAGLPLLGANSQLLAPFPTLTATVLVAEGADVTPGTRIATLAGPGQALLSLERTLLNFLQRLSGIATMTAAYVRAAGPGTRVQETRKTCPGWRALDKYAVAVGGGLNHRMGLHDAVLIKENHLVFAGIARTPGAVAVAVERVRRAAPPGTIIEVEVETLDQLDAALDARADIVLLDNMTTDMHAAAVLRRNARRRETLLEVSGGVTIETLPAIARTGVDRVSVGALTHSVKALDLSFDLHPDAAGSAAR